MQRLRQQERLECERGLFRTGIVRPAKIESEVSFIFGGCNRKYSGGKRRANALFSENFALDNDRLTNAKGTRWFLVRPSNDVGAEF